MDKVVDYYFTPVSPWTYFGHDRFVASAAKHGATVRLKPTDLGKVFPVSGGLPLAKRAPQRQAYRLVELARWRDALGIAINLQPKFVASSGELATRWILAALEQGTKPALDLAGAIMRARFAEEGDIAAETTLASIARTCGLDPRALAARADAPEIAAGYEASTQEAIEGGVFGVPWYVYRGVPFWGQDRLDFLDRALAQ
jgi:2-hydroxychromene-2-carboxylate isomerase